MKRKTALKKYLLVILLLFACASRAAKKHLDILMVTDKFPWASRPFINNQIAGLMDRGHTVYVLATSQEKDIKITPCLIDYSFSGRLFYENLPSHARKFDVILIQFPQSKGNASLYHMYKTGALKGKLVLFFRGEDLSAMIKGDSHRYDGLFQMGDLFLPVCHYFEKRLIKLGCNHKKIKVIHSAIDCDQFSYTDKAIDPTKKITLISACRLVHKKGLKFAVMAAVKLHKQYPNLDYTIIGDGPERTRLSDLISLLGAKQYIHLAGKLPHYKVAKKLKKADIFILPSVTAFHGDQEGIPNALMEAMASGLPVASTYHSGIPELIEHGKRGLLAPERDVDTLVKNITYLLEHPEHTRHMCLNARAYVEQAHNTVIESDKLERLLLELV